MRQSTLVRLAAISLSLGLGALFPTGAAAQSTDRSEIEKAAFQALSRRVQIDLTKGAVLATELAGLRNFTLAPPNGSGPRIKLDSIGDPAFGPPVDCKMPVIKGDPSIDPRILKPLPEDAASHSMRIVVVPRCAQPR